MKLTDTLEDNDVQKIQDDQSKDIEFGIDKEDEWIIFKSFTNYSDKVGSIVREIASNAYDANIEAGSDEDIKIEITEEDDLMGYSSTISFRDYGEGISPDIIRNVYAKFGKSTKRDRNDSIGAFGFGAKAPLCYQDAFDLITIHEGVKYHYSVHAGERRPVVTPLREIETDEPSGTEVIITIKEGDIPKFKNACKEQLKYFDNINYVNCGISNDYKIIRGKHFIYRMSKNHSKYADDKDLHLCLGKVRYPIDSSQIGRWNINVGLYFDIGEIPVVWNRENVEYTDKAIVKIKEKVKLAREELQELYDKQYNEIDSIKKLLESKDLGKFISFVTEKDEDGNEVERGINLFSNFIDTNAFYPKYKKLRVKPKNKHIFSLLRIDKAIDYYNYPSSSLYNFNPLSNNVIVMKKGENYSQLKLEYIKHEEESAKFVRFNPKNLVIRSYLESFYGSHFLKNPYDVDKDERQEIVEEAHELYKEVKEFILDNSKYFSDIEVDEDFKENYLAEKEAERKRKEEIFHYLSVRTKGSFSRTRINGNGLKKKFGDETVIYGFQDDRPALKEVKNILNKELSYNSREHIWVIQISMKNERVVKEVLEDQAVYVHNVEKLRVMRKISNKYNKQAFINDLINHGISLKSLSSNFIPRYIEPEEPTQKEKMEVYETVGLELQYPMLKYTISVPDEIKEEYKKQCPYHGLNPILIGKKHIQENYEEDNSDQE